MKATILIALGAIALAACTSSPVVDEPSTTTTITTPEARTYTGVDGVETDVSDVSRIVSLTGDLTEIIFELGLGDNVVAVDVTTTYPPEAAALNDNGDTVGFGQQLAPEAVLRFNPSLVIGDETIAPEDTITQLRAAGIPVVILKSQTTLDGALEKIEQVAAILDVPAEGQVLRDRVAADIDVAVALAAKADRDLSVLFIYTRGPRLSMIFGAGMPTQAMIEGANAVDAGVALGVFGAGPVTPESLVGAAPDVIVLPESGIEAFGGIEAFTELPGIADTPAAQTGSFLVYEEGYFFNLGPRVGLALQEFVLDLYPELAE